MLEDEQAFFKVHYDAIQAEKASDPRNAFASRSSSSRIGMDDRASNGPARTSSTAEGVPRLSRQVRLPPFTFSLSHELIQLVAGLIRSTADIARAPRDSRRKVESPLRLLNSGQRHAISRRVERGPRELFLVATSCEGINSGWCGRFGEIGFGWWSAGAQSEYEW